MTVRITAALLLGAAVLFSAGPGQAQGPRQPGEPFDDEQPDERTGRDSVTYKLCAAVSLSPFWRDTIPVPNSWTVEDCRQYVGESFGAPAQHQLGCAFSAGRPKVSWSAIGSPGSVPARDCGWGRGRVGEHGADERPRRRRPFREGPPGGQEFGEPDQPGRDFDDAVPPRRRF